MPCFSTRVSANHHRQDEKSRGNTDRYRFFELNVAIEIKRKRRRGSSRTWRNVTSKVTDVQHEIARECHGGNVEGVLAATTCRQMGVVSAITMGVVFSRRAAVALSVAARARCIRLQTRRRIERREMCMPTAPLRALLRDRLIGSREFYYIKLAMPTRRFFSIAALEVSVGECLFSLRLLDGRYFFSNMVM